MALWNHSSAYPTCDKSVIHEKVFADPGVLPEMRLVATIDSRLVGFCVGALRNDTPRGHIKLLAVDPAVRRQGIGSALLSAVEQALAAPTIGAIRIDEAAPNYLTPGLDERNQEALAFFGAHGYDVIGEAQNMSVDLTGRDFSTDAEEESLGERKITIRRASSEDRSAVDRLLDAHWPAWKGEIERAFRNDPISLHVALREGHVIGFSAYDANNVGTGWFGPMGTDPTATGQGIGRALLRRCLADLQSQSRQRATIPWVGPVEFYERHCGAVTSERFLRLEKRI